jgi:hypothetical protein
MKFTDEHYQFLHSIVKPIDDEERRRRYSRGEFVNAHNVNDLTTRYCWDLFYASRTQLRVTNPDLDNEVWEVIKEYQDSHILTALKKIVGVQIEREY